MVANDRFRMGQVNILDGGLVTGDRRSHKDGVVLAGNGHSDALGGRGAEAAGSAAGTAAGVAADVGLADGDNHALGRHAVVVFLTPPVPHIVGPRIFTAGDVSLLPSAAVIVLSPSAYCIVPFSTFPELTKDRASPLSVKIAMAIGAVPQWPVPAPRSRP